MDSNEPEPQPKETLYEVLFLASNYELKMRKVTANSKAEAEEIVRENNVVKRIVRVLVIWSGT